MLCPQLEDGNETRRLSSRHASITSSEQILTQSVPSQVSEVELV